MTTPENIPSLLASLRERQNDLGPLANCRSDTERTVWHKTGTNLASLISQLQNPPDPKFEERLNYWQERNSSGSRSTTNSKPSSVIVPTMQKRKRPSQHCGVAH